MSKEFTLEEVAKHNTYKDCWLAIHGKVYDISSYLDDHPGGGEIVVESSGGDATEDFVDIGHSKDAEDMLEKFLIGTLAAGEIKEKEASAPAKDSAPAPEPKGVMGFLSKLFGK
mmetsp:Transcript_1726/g.2718  ORF Transcript_1726/g.2718 Transcript_1726/m.2718 type:complete len:114 (+) Transcript_1726:200-541(+)